jgi:hypothetical protein
MRYRFTTRDLLLLTAVVAISCVGFANSRQFAAASKMLSEHLSQQAAQIGPPLMGRQSVEPEW